jgi:hypothetical protein
MPGQGGDGEVKDDPREAAFLYGNRNHEYSEAPTWKGDTMDKDAPFTDQYHALVNGEWVECEQVRVIRTANQVPVVSVLYLPEHDDADAGAGG